MPELPEVETARRLLVEQCLGKRVREVVVAEQGGGPRDGLVDDIVISGIAGDAFAASVRGRRVTGVRRKGKHLWVETDAKDKPCIYFHFGMTGSFVVKGLKVQRYVSFDVKEGVWPPRFCKLELVFDDDTRLAFSDARRFGRVRLLADPRAEPPVSELGFDPLDEMPEPAEFRARLRAQTGSSPIKAVLLDQSFSAGVGNYLADEILYQARVHPARPTPSLSDEEVDRVRDAMKHIVAFACEVGADYERFPADWLFHRRWFKGAKTGTKTVDGHTIEYETIAGRTTAFVPAVQGGKTGTRRVADGGGARETEMEAKKETTKKGATKKGATKKGAKEETEMTERVETAGAKTKKGVKKGVEDKEAEEAAAATEAAAGVTERAVRGGRRGAKVPNARSAAAEVTLDTEPASGARDPGPARGGGRRPSAAVAADAKEPPLAPVRGQRKRDRESPVAADDVASPTAEKRSRSGVARRR